MKSSTSSVHIEQEQPSVLVWPSCNKQKTLQPSAPWPAARGWRRPRRRRAAALSGTAGCKRPSAAGAPGCAPGWAPAALPPRLHHDDEALVDDITFLGMSRRTAFSLPASQAAPQCTAALNCHTIRLLPAIAPMIDFRQQGLNTARTLKNEVAWAKFQGGKAAILRPPSTT